MNLSRLALLASLAVTCVFCQDATTEPKLIDYTLSLDTYSETKLSGNFASANLLRNFDISSNRFELAAGSLDLQITKGIFGFHVDAGYGQMYQTMNASDPWHGANRYFGQTYVTLRPIKGSDLSLDFGKFYTSAGAEVPDVASNFQYSRSLLFTLGVPYYHFGVRASKSLFSKDLVVGAQVMNGWNDVVNNTGGQTVGLTATYTKKLYNWTATYLVGPEPVFLSAVNQPLAVRPKKISQLGDSVLKLTPKDRLNAYVEVLYGEEKNVLGRDRWWGVAGSASLPIINRWSFCPRWEFFNDPTGATTGVAQRIQEVTGSFQYQPKLKDMAIRAELRNDFSNQMFFAKSKTQATALLAVLYTFKRR